MNEVQLSPRQNPCGKPYRYPECGSRCILRGGKAWHGEAGKVIRMKLKKGWVPRLAEQSFSGRVNLGFSITPEEVRRQKCSALLTAYSYFNLVTAPEDVDRAIEMIAAAERA